MQKAQENTVFIISDKPIPLLVQLRIKKTFEKVFHFLHCLRNDKVLT